MSVSAELDRVRANAKTLLDTVGVSRVLVIDDEYADWVERLLGICSELESADAGDLPHLEGVQFDAPTEIWTNQVRAVWERLHREERRETLAAARHLESASEDGAARDGPAEPPGVDDRAADCLEDVLGSIGGCEFVTLSLGDWEERREAMLAEDAARRTLFLFDRGYGDERAGTDDEGFELIREVLKRDSGACGLITHTVPAGAEYQAWQTMATQHDLDRDRFVVVAKGRLNGERPDYYGFLAMVRLAALCDRYAEVRSIAWSAFEASVSEAKSELDDLTVLDFDRVVFASSRQEGVWETDTLFRVFGILMRQQAGRRLRADANVLEAVAGARRVSAMPVEITEAFAGQRDPAAALRIQRFEVYDAGGELNDWHTPIGLGDIFQIAPTGNDYILLGQPCDLVVRSKGLRNHEDRWLGPMVAVAEIARGEDRSGAVWGKLPFYEEESGGPAFVSYVRVHQVRLAVLDLCVFRPDGSAAIDLGADCPDGLIEAWRKRYGKIKSHFRDAFDLHSELVKAGVDEASRSVALPDASTTLQVEKTLCGNTVRYGVERVLRLRQPWSAALLTEFAQYRARPAFEHSFGERVEGDP